MVSSNAFRPLTIALAPVFLAACMVGPDYVRPEPPLPPAWHTSVEPVSFEPGAPVGRWWDQFRDPELTRLVERAVHANLDLVQATARVAEAQALYGATASALFPAIDAQGDVFRQRSSVNALFPGGDEDTLYQIGVSAGWEVDLWGRVRRSVESAGASLEASDEDRRAVLVAVMAEVARSYLDARTLQQRLAVARKNLESQRQIVELTRVRFEGGIASSLDVAQAESVYASTRTIIPPFESALA